MNPGTRLPRFVLEASAGQALAPTLPIQRWNSPPGS